MIAEIRPEALQIPENALWILAGWVLTTLLAGWSGYRWGIQSQIAAKKLEIRTDMLAIIEQHISRASGDDWHGLRPDSIDTLAGPAVKLLSLTNGRSHRKLSETWENFSKTTPAEFHVPQYDENQEQTQKMRETFISRLKALRASVQAI